MTVKPNSKKLAALYEKYGIIVILILEVIFFSIKSPTFLKLDNILLVSRQVSFYGIAAVGMTMVLLVGEIGHFKHRHDVVLHAQLAEHACLLRQVADFNAGLRTRFTFDLGVDTGHDAQQGRFTGAVQTEHTDFRAREKAEGDIFQNMTFRRNHFADTMHGINELSHVGLRLFLF